MAKYAITYTTHVLPGSTTGVASAEYDLHIYIINKELQEFRVPKNEERKKYGKPTLGESRE